MRSEDSLLIEPCEVLDEVPEDLVVGARKNSLKSRFQGGRQVTKGCDQEVTWGGNNCMTPIVSIGRRTAVARLGGGVNWSIPGVSGSAILHTEAARHA